MKKFIYTIILFSLFTTIIYIGGIFLFGSSSKLRKLKPNIEYKLGAYGHMNSRIKEIKHVNDVDVLFLGSSHSYRGFDTRIFENYGLKTFNLGSSAQTPIQTEALLNRYLDKIKPKMVVYEVFPSTFVSDGVESSLDIVSNDQNDIYSYLMAFKTNHILTYNTLLFSTLRDIFNLDNDFKEPIKNGEDTYISGGFVEKEISYYEPQELKEKELTLDKKQLKAFERNINLLKEKEINFLLVFAPITKGRYSTYTNNDYYDSLMKSYGKYYNFNEIVRLEDSLHFYDTHHLNQKGVVLFNEKLLDLIE